MVESVICLQASAALQGKGCSVSSVAFPCTVVLPVVPGTRVSSAELTMGPLLEQRLLRSCAKWLRSCL